MPKDHITEGLWAVVSLDVELLGLKDLKYLGFGTLRPHFGGALDVEATGSKMKPGVSPVASHNTLPGGYPTLWSKRATRKGVAVSAYRCALEIT